MRVAIVQLLERTNDQAIVDQTIGVARHDAFCDRIEEGGLFEGRFSLGTIESVRLMAAGERSV